MELVRAGGGGRRVRRHQLDAVQVGGRPARLEAGALAHTTRPASARRRARRRERAEGEEQRGARAPCPRAWAAGRHGRAPASPTSIRAASAAVAPRRSCSGPATTKQPGCMYTWLRLTWTRSASSRVSSCCAPSPKLNVSDWSPRPCAWMSNSTVAPTVVLVALALSSTVSGRRFGSSTSLHAAMARASNPTHKRVTFPPSGNRPFLLPVHHRCAALRRRQQQQLEHVDVRRSIHRVEHRVRDVVARQGLEPTVHAGRTLAVALEPHDRELGLDEPGV